MSDEPEPAYVLCVPWRFVASNPPADGRQTPCVECGEPLLVARSSWDNIRKGYWRARCRGHDIRGHEYVAPLRPEQREEMRAVGITDEEANILFARYRTLYERRRGPLRDSE